MKLKTKLFVLGMLIIGVWLMWPKTSIKEEHKKFIEQKNKKID